jgi:hypothetical protein
MRELHVIEYEGYRRWCDYSVIKVHPNRAGVRNYVTRGGVSSGFQFYFPRDRDGVYIIGVGEPSAVLPVRKTGRSTGRTEGRIELAYSFANIEDAGQETREWCVVEKWTNAHFSHSGDSGAPVVDPTGAVVGFVFAGCPGKPMELKGHEELEHVYVSYIASAKMVLEKISAGIGREIELVVIPDLGEYSGNRP